MTIHIQHGELRHDLTDEEDIEESDNTTINSVMEI